MAKRIIVGVVAIAMVFSFAGSFGLANAQTTVDNSASAAVLTQFNRNLTIGSSGADVAALQTILVSGGYLVMPAGVAKGYFGPLTRAAVAKWQTAVGIYPTAGYFGPISRAKMNSSVVANPVNPCPTGYTASGMNPVICTPSSSTPAPDDDDDDNDNDGPLSGGEASLENFSLNSGNDSEVEEGDSAEIAEIEFDVEDGDVRLERVDLVFVGTGNEEDEPWEAFESIALLVDGEEIASEDVSDEDDWLDEDDGSFRFSGINHIFREGDTALIVVEVTAQGSVDGADSNDATWTVSVDGNDGIRAIDSEGIDQYTGGSDEVDFDIVEEGEGEELNVSSSNSDIDTETFMVEDDGRSDWYDIFAFDLEAEESDIDIDTVTVRLTTSATTSDMVSDLMLAIDGEEFDDWSYVGTPAAGSSTVDVEFDIDGDYTLDADSEVVVMLSAEFKAANGVGYSSSTTNTIQARILSGGVEGEGADDVTSSGSATGDTHTLSLEGIMVSKVSTDADSTGTDDTVGKFTFVIDVEAFEEDAWIELAATRGTTTDNTGFNVLILDGNNNVVTTGTTTYSVSADEDESSNNRVEVGEGDTVRFTVTVFFDALTAGAYKGQLHSVNFNDTDDDEDTQYELLPVSTYRTTSTYVE